MMGAIFGLLLALCVASSLRRTSWPHERPSLRYRDLALALCPVIATALIASSLSIEAMQSRREFCTMMIAYHEAAEKAALDAKSAAESAYLKEGFRYTMWRPWLPIHPAWPPPKP